MDFEIHDWAPEGASERTFEYLMKAARLCVPREIQTEIRLSALNDHTGGKQSNANRFVTLGNPEGKPDCKFWKKFGNCKAGADCEFVHDAAKKGKHAQQKWQLCQC